MDFKILPQMLRRTLKPMAILLAMALLALATSVAVAAGAARFMAGRGFAGLTLAFASPDDDERLQWILPYLEEMKDIAEYASFVQTTPQEARQMVQSGQAAAAVLLPEGFFNSLATGENASPTLVVNAARPLEMLLVGTLAQSAIRMLVSAQQGIAATMAAYQTGPPAGLQQNDAMVGVNLEYGYWVLGRAQIYRTSTVYATGQLPLQQHYILSSLVFFALLCTPVLYPVLSLWPAMGWVRRLKAAGRSVAGFAGAQIVGGAVALFAMLLLLAAGTGAWALFAGQTAAVGFGLLLGLLLCAAFAACFGFLCCNAGGIMPASLLAFFCAVLGLFVAGGVLPPVLLPGAIAHVAPYTPVALMRSALAPLFGQPVNGKALFLLLVWVALLYTGCMLLGRGKGRNPVEVEE